MGIKSTVWHQEFERVGERSSKTVYLQSIPEGFRDRSGEQWFSLETQTTDYLELPESQMRKLVDNLQQALERCAQQQAELQKRLDREDREDQE